MAEDVRVIALLLEERFRIRGQKNELQGERAVKRHQEMWERYREVIGEYLRLTDSIQAKDTTGPALSAISQLKKLLRRVLLRKKIPVYGSLPYRHLEYPGRLPKSEPEITPAYKGGDGSVREGDLADTGIAPISEEIAAMAQSLKWNPVNIYEYVKNNIETEWYWGCMKGAEETLRQGAGNDCDQATLLVALFRASGYPARYVRGVIEFFHGGGSPIEKARNLTGVEDPVGIAEYFQKAGIPCEPVIEGGRIVNLRMEHIWAEVLVPYSNYRGAVLDEEGKIWLGLDTSIKAAGYEYSSPVDITKDLPLSEIKDRYLGSIQPLTPLEFLRAGIEDYLAQSGSGMHYEDLLMTGRQVAEVMNILPSAMQFREVAITGEYDDMPEELVHKVRFIASRQDTVDSIQGNLLEITLPVYRVSSGRVVISYEPETVEDHKIINAYGGLDRTPCYLVRVRPVLIVNGRRVAVGSDGLPVGEKYDLTVEILSPSGSIQTGNSHVAGNLAVIAIASRGKSIQAKDTTGQTAENLLYEEAMNYIKRWNSAEEELASLLRLNIIRPVPAIVTIGGVIDVTYLLDTPHEFKWRGVYIDVNLKAVEVVDSRQGTPGSGWGPGEREKLFMQISALQGSVLEHRIFEDDWEVESISTAKLFSIAGSRQETGDSVEILTINKSNVETVLPSLSLDDNIKEDIRNTVNQGMVVYTPYAISQEPYAISHGDWTGMGYIKENPETGESGYMLSGMIAGGMTAISPEEWVDQELADKLRHPYSWRDTNDDPLSAYSIIKVSPTDMQWVRVNTAVPQPLQVLVRDRKYRPVKGAEVTFRVVSGGGYLGAVSGTTGLMVITDEKGIASVAFTTGKETGANPSYSKIDSRNDKYETQIGVNHIKASVKTRSGILEADAPFEIYGIPAEPDHLVIIQGDGLSGLVNTYTGSLAVRVEDGYGNPVSNREVTYTVLPARPVDKYEDLGIEFYKDYPKEYRTSDLPDAYRNLKLFQGEKCIEDIPVLTRNCNLSDTLQVKSRSDGLAVVEGVYGDSLATKYTVEAKSQGLPVVYLTLYTEGWWKYGRYVPPFLYATLLVSGNEEGGITDAAGAGKDFSYPIRLQVIYSMPEYTLENTPELYLKGTGRFTAGRVTNAVISPFVQGEAEVKKTVNRGDGTYEIWLRAGDMPGEATIEVRGSAVVKVPRIRENPAEFVVEDIDLGIGKDVCYIRSEIDYTETKRCDRGNILKIRDVAPPPLSVVYSVLPEITGLTPSVLLVDSTGLLQADTTIQYRIEPVQYSARRTDFVVYENGRQWITVPGAVQGSGEVMLLRGTEFSAGRTYSAELILNNGQEMEIRSEVKILPLAGVKVRNYLGDVAEIRYSDGGRGEKRYGIELESKALTDTCEGLRGRIRVVDRDGVLVSTPDVTGYYPVEYPLHFVLSGGKCTVEIEDSTGESTKMKSEFIVSNLSKTALGMRVLQYQTPPDLNNEISVLYGGIGNQVEIEINGAKLEIPIEPVGVIVIGIDGLRQDVLYALDEASYIDPGGCGGQSCYIDLNNLSGLSQLITYEGTVKLRDVTAIFPSITLASWASIFTGKMPKETGILGNEFFARDLYSSGRWRNIPGMWNHGLPKGMITLADGAFPNNTFDYYLKNLVPAHNYSTTVQQKNKNSSAGKVLSEEVQTVYEWLNHQDRVMERYGNTQDCMTGGECASAVFFSHYGRGANWWGTQEKNFIEQFFVEVNLAEPIAKAYSRLFPYKPSELLDATPTEEAKKFLERYYPDGAETGGRDFPALFVLYYGGPDHYAHDFGLGGSAGDYRDYRDYIVKYTDQRILEVVNALREIGEFDNKIFIITADHGHTAMPTGMTYTHKEELELDSGIYIEYEMPAETSCKLNLDFQIDPENPETGMNNQRAEAANNNLHIWELGEMFKYVGKKIGLNYRVLAPEPIAELFKDKGGTELPYGATADINKANVIVAMNGPMAHVYLKSSNDWRTIPDQKELGLLALVFQRVFQEGGTNLDENQRIELKNKFPNLLLSIDKILIRVNGEYKVFKGLDNLGNAIVGELTEMADVDYVKAIERIKGLNHPDRSGDIVLIMKDRMSDSVDNRYTTGTACKSWHGSLNPSDSYVPFIVAYPRGNKYEIEPFIYGIEGCDIVQGCDGNWRVTDLIKTIVSKQYNQ